MNIKGLYFKLNIDKQTDKDIYNFFIQESKERGIDKITLLFDMMCIYKGVRLKEQLQKEVFAKRHSEFDFKKLFKEIKQWTLM